MRSRLAIFAAAVCLMLAGPERPGAQSAEGQYLTPPPDIVKAIDASELPQWIVSPTKKVVAQITLDSVPSIEQLSQPMLRLAGMRINPETNNQHFNYRASPIAKLSLMTLGEKKERPIHLPAGGGVQWSRFSPDGSRIALTQATAKGVSLLLVDAASGTVKPLTPPVLNGTWGEPCRWLDDGRALLCRTVTASRGQAPREARVPGGPRVQEHEGKAAPLWTSQDLLTSAHDDALFEHYFTSQLAIVDATTGSVAPFGAPGLFSEVSASPSGEYVLVTRVKRPFSRIVGANGFASDVEVLDRKGTRVRSVGSLDLAESVPINGVRPGARVSLWNPAKPGSLIWVEALDGGDPAAKVPHRDRVQQIEAPFTGSPTELARIESRYQSIQFTAQGVGFLAENDRGKRWTRTWMLEDGKEPRKLFDRASEDRYADPGTFVVTHKPLPVGDPTLGEFGTPVDLTIAQTGRSVYLSGEGASPEGDRPFLDRLDLDSMKAERLFRSEGERYEVVTDIFSPDASSILTRRETRSSPPNLILRDLKAGGERALTALTDQTPALSAAEKQLLTYDRKDGVKLSATLYLPADRRTNERLPLIVWAYPREFIDNATASQVVGSAHRYNVVSFGNIHLITVLQGYALMIPTMPIVGPGETANDSYVEQLVASAQASVDKAVELGIADRDRVGVAGHSYGAFMTANLLAHSDIFRTGIALSGAYNRSLTPFGFQNERRTFWDKPDLYARLSPFWHAQKVNEPVLLMHGEVDNNQGTFPIQTERFYLALKGHGARVRYVTLPYESHRYASRETLLHVAAEFVTWFDRYVKGAGPRATTATGRGQ
ncbi:MAG: prolyl oligopeptidase family serine peptidase [Vicinamibacterales bacterium]